MRRRHSESRDNALPEREDRNYRLRCKCEMRRQRLQKAARRWIGRRSC